MSKYTVIPEERKLLTQVLRNHVTEMVYARSLISLKIK